MGHIALLVIYTRWSTAHGTGLRSSKGTPFLFCVPTPAISSCGESANLNKTANAIVTSTKFSKEKAVKLDRGGVLLDLIRPSHCGLLTMLEREHRKAKQFPSLKPVFS